MASVTELLNARAGMVKVLQYNLLKAKRRMKVMADKKRNGAVASTALPLTELKSYGTIKAAPVTILAKRLWEGIAYQWRRIWCRGRIFVRKSPLGKISSSYNLKFLLEERVVLRGRQCYFSSGSNYWVSSCHDSTDCKRPIIKAITFVSLLHVMAY
ncbi:hypothetical protein OIU76_015294 [Salix suchowensis]|nr:hypothetical protein OIU76_015294 [Salix suchowensis]